MDSDAEAIDQMEEARKRIQRELDEKCLHLEEKAAHADKVHANKLPVEIDNGAPSIPSIFSL